MAIKIERDTMQRDVHSWCVAAFGDNHAKSLKQRAVRCVEEVLEAAQVAEVDPDMLHRLIDYVYARPVGVLSQELGGIGVTLLAFAAAAEESADACERAEVDRIWSKDIEHFAQRNAAKNAAGFNVT